MIIKLLNKNVVNKSSKQGKPYKAVEVSYVSDGRTSNFTLFRDDPMAERILGAVDGSFYDVGVVKDGKYYKWTSWKESEAPVETQATAGASKESYKAPANSTYSTKEEREDTQRKIVRQFAINAAISLLKNDKKIPDNKEILEQAERFVDFVFEKTNKDVSVSLKDLQDDIPQ